VNGPCCLTRSRQNPSVNVQAWMSSLSFSAFVYYYYGTMSFRRPIKGHTLNSQHIAVGLCERLLSFLPFLPFLYLYFLVASRLCLLPSHSGTTASHTFVSKQKTAVDTHRPTTSVRENVCKKPKT